MCLKCWLKKWGRRFWLCPMISGLKSAELMGRPYVSVLKRHKNPLRRILCPFHRIYVERGNFLCLEKLNVITYTGEIDDKF